MKTTGNGAFLTVTSSPLRSILVNLPSQNRERAPPSSANFTLRMLESAYTMGRLCRECAHTGVRINAAISGVRIDPPAESEYAVEPVGVLTISPSPTNLSTFFPFISAHTATTLSSGRRIVTALKNDIVEGVSDEISGTDLEDAPALCSVLFQKKAHGFFGLVPFKFRQKSQIPRIDPEQRHAALSRFDGRFQDRSVAPQYDEYVFGAEAFGIFVYIVLDRSLTKSGEQPFPDDIKFFCFSVTEHSDMHASIIQYFIHLCNQISVISDVKSTGDDPGAICRLTSKLLLFVRLFIDILGRLVGKDALCDGKEFVLPAALQLQRRIFFAKDFRDLSCDFPRAHAALFHIGERSCGSFHLCGVFLVLLIVVYFSFEL